MGTSDSGAGQPLMKENQTVGWVCKHLKSEGDLKGTDCQQRSPTSSRSDHALFLCCAWMLTEATQGEQVLSYTTARVAKVPQSKIPVEAGSP